MQIDWIPIRYVNTSNHHIFEFITECLSNRMYSRLFLSFLLLSLWLNLLCTFVGHKGPGSVFATLQDKGWAMSNSAGKKFYARGIWNNYVSSFWLFWTTFLQTSVVFDFTRNADYVGKMSEKWIMFLHYNLSSPFIVLSLLLNTIRCAYLPYPTHLVLSYLILSCPSSPLHLLFLFITLLLYISFLS